MSPSTETFDAATSFWKVANHAANKTEGFWAPMTATHAFCEPHYSVSPFVAEFYNSATSLIYVFLAIYLRNKFPGDRYVQFSNIWLAIIGLGSTAFHGMMKYSTQLMDEIPMVVMVTALLVAKVQAPHTKWMKPHRFWSSALIVGTSVCVIFTYMVLGNYEYFFHGFGLLCLYDAVTSIITLKRGTSTARLHLVTWAFSGGGIMVGRAFWESENRLCHLFPSIWPFHCVWHVFSCLSAYGALTFTYIARMDETKAPVPHWVVLSRWAPTNESNKLKET